MTDEHPIERRETGRPWARDHDRQPAPGEHPAVAFVLARLDGQEDAGAAPELIGLLRWSLLVQMGLGQQIFAKRYALTWKEHPDFDPAWKVSD